MLHEAFGRRCTQFQHDFLGRPELSLDALADIAPRLPASWIYGHQAQHSPLEGRGQEPPIDCARIPEFIGDLQNANVSIRMYNLERTPEYGPLAEEFETLMREYVGTREGGLHAINLGVFIASPGSVTPAHPDRHHNFLMQLAGTKDVWLEHDPDARAQHRRVIDYLRCPAAGLEELPPGNHYCESPGDALYIPPYTFHWTELGHDPGVALSIGFSTPATRQWSDAHEFDLRAQRVAGRVGWRPGPASMDSVVGRTKARLGHLAMKRTARRHAQAVSVSSPTGGQ